MTQKTLLSDCMDVQADLGVCSAHIHVYTNYCTPVRKHTFGYIKNMQTGRQKKVREKSRECHNHKPQPANPEPPNLTVSASHLITVCLETSVCRVTDRSMQIAKAQIRLLLED